MIDIQNIISKTKWFEITVDLWKCPTDSGSSIFALSPIIILHYDETSCENKLIETLTSKRIMSVHMNKKFLFKPNVIRFYVAQKLNEFLTYHGLYNLDAISLSKRIVPQTLEKIAANKFHESLKLNLCMININGIMENML